MKTVDDFLAEVASSRLDTQIEERKAFRAPPGFELPCALEVALRHRWQIAPVLARSELAVNSASGGVPSSDCEQIEYWLARYPEANWSLVTGPASGVTALEIETGWRVLGSPILQRTKATGRALCVSRPAADASCSSRQMRAFNPSPSTPACDCTPARGFSFHLLASRTATNWRMRTRMRLCSLLPTGYVSVNSSKPTKE
jgi:hypothetical protein